MPTIITADLTMCADCALIIANDDDSSMSPDERRAHTLAMFETTKTWTGQIVVGEHTDNFSSRPCDTCNTTLAGDRFSGSLLESVPGEPRMALVERTR